MLNFEDSSNKETKEKSNMFNRCFNVWVKIVWVITYMSSQVNSVLVFPILISDNITFDAGNDIPVCWIRYRLFFFLAMNPYSKTSKLFFFLISSSTSFPVFSTTSYLANTHALHFLFSKLTTPTNGFSAAVCPHIRSPGIPASPIRKHDPLPLFPTN